MVVSLARLPPQQFRANVSKKPELQLKLGPMKNEIQTGRNPDGYIYIYIYIYAGANLLSRTAALKKKMQEKIIYIYILQELANNR